MNRANKKKTKFYKIFIVIILILALLFICVYKFIINVHWDAHIYNIILSNRSISFDYKYMPTPLFTIYKYDYIYSNNVLYIKFYATALNAFRKPYSKIVITESDIEGITNTEKIILINTDFDVEYNKDKFDIQYLQ